MTDTEDFFARFADELNDPKALSLEEIQRAMPVHGDTRETMIARNNRNNPKRLANAELAAEYWRAQDDVSCADDPSGSKPGTWPNGYDRENGQFLDDARLETLERFATLPHYDEVPE